MVKHITIGAGGLGFDSRAGQIEHSVANTATLFLSSVAQALTCGGGPRRPPLVTRFGRSGSCVGAAELQQCSTPRTNQPQKTDADFFNQMQFLKLFNSFLFRIEKFIPNPVYIYNFSNSNNPGCVCARFFCSKKAVLLNTAKDLKLMY